MDEDRNQRAIDDPVEGRRRCRSRRRVLLSSMGVLATAAVAGCMGDGGDSGQEETGTTAGEGGNTDTPGTTDETAAATTETDGDGGDDAGGEETADGSDDGGGTADPSSVAFDRSWQERIDFQERISGRNFGAAVTSDGLFFGAEWGFAALGLDDGDRVWETSAWDGLVDVHADSDAVVAYTKSFDIVSLDPADGSEQWRTSTAGSENPNFETALTSSYFVAESADGIGVHERGSGETVTQIGGAPRGIVASDDTLVAPGSGQTVVYDLPSGNERWREDLILGSGSVLDDGRLVGIEVGVGPDATDRLTAVDLASGDQVWNTELGTGSLTRANIATENRVAAFISGGIGEESTVYAHDLDDGSQLWTKDVGRVSRPFAVIDSGVVVAPLRTENGRAKIRAFGARSGDQLAETDGGLGVTKASAIDRTFLEIELNEVTAFEF